MNYLINKNADTYFQSGKEQVAHIELATFQLALQDFQEIISLIMNDIPVDIFSILGMRNLSAFVGELFSKSLSKASKGKFISNPHQDGYPDLLLMDDIGKEIYAEISKQAGLRDKAPFSPFLNGGIEVKATCGVVPTPTQCQKKGFNKPDIGDTRINLLTGYDWKAHHRETNNLVGLLWDFINKKPCITAIFFGNNLNSEDWGKIVQPIEGGGRTTSVSIMTRCGVNKMYRNWIMVRNDHSYIHFINKYNRGQQIPN